MFIFSTIKSILKFKRKKDYKTDDKGQIFLNTFRLRTCKLIKRVSVTLLKSAIWAKVCSS